MRSSETPTHRAIQVLSEALVIFEGIESFSAGQVRARIAELEKEGVINVSEPFLL
jgi:hypothetical protein